MKVLIIDNFDSFTYNLVQLVAGFAGYHTVVVRIDSVQVQTPDEFDGIIISPGPGVPSDSSILNTIIRRYENKKSILGICLGHQAIAEAYGGKIVNMKKVFHGIKEEISVSDSSDYLFMNIPQKISGGLYHSWKVDKKTFPSELKITAKSSHNVIMALSHKIFDVKGLQFHPESFMTDFGQQIINNWLNHIQNKITINMPE